MADIKQYEKEINIIDPHAHVSVINDADLEGPPRQMQYINAYKASEGISIPDDPLIGCECESCDIKHEKSCCGGAGGNFNFAYTKFSKLRIEVKRRKYSDCDVCTFRLVHLYMNVTRDVRAVPNV